MNLMYTYSTIFLFFPSPYHITFDCVNQSDEGGGMAIDLNIVFLVEGRRGELVS